MSLTQVQGSLTGQVLPARQLVWHSAWTPAMRGTPWLISKLGPPLSPLPTVSPPLPLGYQNSVRSMRFTVNTALRMTLSVDTGMGPVGVLLASTLMPLPYTAMLCVSMSCSEHSLIGRT